MNERRYWMVRLGAGGSYAQELIAAGEIGVDFVGDLDLTPYLSVTSKPFHEELNTVYRERHPEKTKIAVGMAIGNLWVATCDIREGDVVVSLAGAGGFAVGEVTGPYRWAAGDYPYHRRAVRWDVGQISRDSMGAQLRLAVAGPMTVFNLDPYGAEIEALRTGGVAPTQANLELAHNVDDRVAFQLEKQLEDFLVQNWSGTALARDYDIYQDENGTGQQYPSDTGRIDILAVSKDKRRILVIELKRGRPSDDVVGQVLRYMGWAKRELAEADQIVEGLIIALDDDLRVRNALGMVPNVRFMTYRVRFELSEIEVQRL